MSTNFHYTTTTTLPTARNFNPQNLYFSSKCLEKSCTKIIFLLLFYKKQNMKLGKKQLKNAYMWVSLIHPSKAVLKMKKKLDIILYNSFSKSSRYEHSVFITKLPKISCFSLFQLGTKKNSVISRNCHRKKRAVYKFNGIECKKSFN